MANVQVSEYRFLNGEMVATGKDSGHPHELPEWKYDESSRVFVISVRNGDGGMFNERKATFSVKGMKRNERQRIDILVWGPPEKVKIAVK